MILSKAAVGAYEHVMHLAGESYPISIMLSCVAYKLEIQSHARAEVAYTWSLQHFDKVLLPGCISGRWHVRHFCSMPHPLHLCMSLTMSIDVGLPLSVLSMTMKAGLDPGTIL